MWPDGTHSMLFAESNCVPIPTFRTVAQFFFFWGKNTIFGICLYRGVWPYKYAYDVPLVTLIFNIYMGLCV